VTTSYIAVGPRATLFLECRTMLFLLGICKGSAHRVMWLSGVAPLLLRLYTDGLGLRRAVKYYCSEFPWRRALEPWAGTGARCLFFPFDPNRSRDFQLRVCPGSIRNEMLLLLRD